MKKDTLEELEMFQKSLGEGCLDSEVEKSKAELMAAVKKNLNKEEVMKTFMGVEAAHIRGVIAKIETSYHMKQITEKEYVNQKTGEIVKIRELGAELTPAEEEFIDIKGKFKEEKFEKMNSKTENEYLNVAQKEIKKNLN